MADPPHEVRVAPFCQGAASTVAASREDRACAAELALQCFGVLGALDPARLSTVSGVSALRASNSKRDAVFTAHATDDELSVQLVEGYFREVLRAAAQGQVVQSTAYALIQLVQSVCHCNGDTPANLHIWETFTRSAGQAAPSSWRRLSEDERTALRFWGSLGEATRPLVLPYLTMQVRALLPPRPLPPLGLFPSP